MAEVAMNSSRNPNPANFQTLSGFSFGARQLFYLVTPGESTFEKVEEVPNYVNQAFPFFVLLIALESLLLYLHKDKPFPRWNDALSSISAGLISQLPIILVRNIEAMAYIYVYNNYRVYELPWESPITWVVAFLLVDLGYYWVHRMAHEVNFMWAAHQVHHSSEDYNLASALRQSVLQRYSSWMFYLPMALFVPPSHFIAHIQFNLLYQFWIHTEAVRSIGPLEYILNTASHHRVHHGRNRYCIDKNYAGVLIIWDRIFDTFAAEDEEVVYGLVHPLSSWDPIYTQFCHWKYILQTAWATEGLGNKVSVFLKGPGWSPGKPRLGEITDIPDIKGPQPKYDKSLPLFGTLYCWGHFFMAFVGQDILTRSSSALSQWTVLMFVLFILWTLTNLGYLFEHKWYAGPLEVLRCLTVIVFDAYVCSNAENSCPASLYLLRGVFFFSIVAMLVHCARTVQDKPKKQN